MGGSLSHEYHYLTNIGEDEVVTCPNCNYSANTQLVGKEKCSKCDSSEALKISRGIEVKDKRKTSRCNSILIFRSPIPFCWETSIQSH